MKFSKPLTVVAASVIAAGIAVAVPMTADAKPSPASSHERWGALCAKIGGTDNPNQDYLYCYPAAGSGFKYAQVGVLETYCNSLNLVIDVYPSGTYPPLGTVHCGQNF